MNFKVTSTCGEEAVVEADSFEEAVHKFHELYPSAEIDICAEEE